MQPAQPAPTYPAVITPAAGPDFKTVWRRTTAIIAVVFVWIANLYFPITPTVALDASWQLALNEAWEQRLVFGRDIVFTYGPWGWLGTQYYYEPTFVARMTWEFAFKALASFLIVMAATTLSWPRRLAFIAAALVLPPLFQDTLPFLVTVGLVVLLLRCPLHPAWGAAAGLLLGFLALQKFTFLLLAAVGLTAIVGQLAAVRRWRDLAWIAGGALGSFLLGWIAAAQPLSALPQFLRHSLWIASGYSEAMGLNESPVVFWAGLTCALTYLFLVWASPRSHTIWRALALTAAGFLVWKHGFVRADGHTLGFFLPMLFAALAAPWLSSASSAATNLLSVLLAGSACLGAWAAEPTIGGNIRRALQHHLAAKAHAVLHLDTLQYHLDLAVDSARAKSDFPAIFAKLGSEPADQFGYEQSAALLNGFTYQPRPVLQGFQAYSGPLAELNEQAYLSASGPPYVLARLQSIDGRYPPLDDARALLRLITDHALVAEEKNMLLFTKRLASREISLEPTLSGKLRYGTEQIPLTTDGVGVWARIDTPYSWLGWLRALFYKPPEITLLLRDDQGLEERYRFVIPAARGGFLLSPKLVTSADLAALVSSGNGHAVRGVRLEMAPSARKYFLNRARFELFTLSSVRFTSNSGP